MRFRNNNKWTLHHLIILLLSDESGRLNTETSLNWELFSSKGNRFFLPGSLGPAWINNLTTIYADVQVEDLVDFDGAQADKLHIRCRSCPQLLRENLHEIFPAPEVATKSSPLTLIELTYPRETGQTDTETEKGAKLVSGIHKSNRKVKIKRFIHFYSSLFSLPVKSVPALG